MEKGFPTLPQLKKVMNSKNQHNPRFSYIISIFLHHLELDVCNFILTDNGETKSKEGRIIAIHRNKLRETLLLLKMEIVISV